MYYNNSSPELDIHAAQNWTVTGDATNATDSTPRWALIGLAVIPAWILFGNLMVLLAVLLQKNLRTLSNWVIASLAFTDFLLALIVVPLGTYQVVSYVLSAVVTEENCLWKLLYCVLQFNLSRRHSASSKTTSSLALAPPPAPKT